MSALKHMEVIFGAVVAVGCVIAALPGGDTDAPAPASNQATGAGMPVVVVKAKRMTALEKRESLGADERAAAAGS